MAIETDADRALFLSADEFGRLARWTTGAGTSPVFACIFDDTFVALSAGELGFEQEGGNIRIEMRTSDVPAGAAQKNVIQLGQMVDGSFVGGQSYKVMEFRPDGTGMTVVRLMEA